MQQIRKQEEGYNIMSLLEQERIYKAYERSILGEGKKKECPDGHEWDEKLQECLPSSTGIKEDEVDEKKKECPDGHEWDEKMQECLPSSTGIKEELDEAKSKTPEQALQRIITIVENIKKSDGWKSSFAGGNQEVRDAYGPSLFDIQDQAKQVQKMLKGK